MSYLDHGELQAELSGRRPPAVFGRIPAARRSPATSGDPAASRGLPRDGVEDCRAEQPLRSSIADRTFDRAYLAGVSDPLGGRPPGRAAAGAFALGGRVITADGPLVGGYVVVDAGQVTGVRLSRRDSVPVLETSGVLVPGLIDLHGHPESNLFAAWEPPTHRSRTATDGGPVNRTAGRSTARRTSCSRCRMDMWSGPASGPARRQLVVCLANS